MQTRAPQLGLTLQQRPQLPRGEVPQIEDFDLGSDRQAGHKIQSSVQLQFDPKYLSRFADVELYLRGAGKIADFYCFG
jgi:hypothetical protein